MNKKTHNIQSDKFSEKDLENYIYSNKNRILAHGLPIHGEMLKQIQISKYGVIDLMSIIVENNKVKITIFELKLGKIGYKEISQISRYISGIYHLFSNFAFGINKELEVDGCLIGNSIELDKDFDYLLKNSYWLKIYKYSRIDNKILFNLHNTKRTKIDKHKITKVIKRHILDQKYISDTKEYLNKIINKKSPKIF